MKPTLPALLAIALALASSVAVEFASAAQMSVVNCSGSYGCVYVAEDGKIYNPQGNAEV